MSEMKWDAFICHAYEDKPFVATLANALRQSGLRVWYDEFSLTLGDSLRQSIDCGLAQSQFGIVVLSASFFEKKWTQYELDGLVERDLDKKVVLPIWHNIAREDLVKYSPSLANKVAIISTRPLSEIVLAIRKAIFPQENIFFVEGADSISDFDSGTQFKKPRLDLLRDLPTIQDAADEE